MNFTQKGFSLLETLIGVAVFLIVATSIYQGFLTVSRAVEYSRNKLNATALATEIIEITRNLSYEDVGIVGGIPDGKIPRDRVVSRDGREFEIETTVRNIDDSFDGLFPSDSSPADYKLVEIEISCPDCRNFEPLTFNTNIGSGGLETSTGNGALFVRVFDAVGQPVQDAKVYVENSKATSTIVIEDTTDADGFLKIVDAPPGFEAYEISIAKEGYSSEQTYSDDLITPNPTRPHSTVEVQQLTQISFAIDEVSRMKVSSLNEVCASIPNLEFDIYGSKIISTGPDVLKFNETKNTGSSGSIDIADLEWDTYSINVDGGPYQLAGSIPLLPISLDPGTTQDLRLILEPVNEKSLLINVKDLGSDLPLSDASVNLTSTGGYDETLIAGRGFLSQNDWSGGSGQEDFIDLDRYFSSSDVDVLESVGELKLTKIIVDDYALSGVLESSTFDTGSASNFHRVTWLPQDQPVETGTSSVKVQVATNNDGLNWEFLGPDGTDQTFYTQTEHNINSVHNGDRFLRYKVYLSTEDQTKTPTVSDVSFTFTSDCVPPGQVFFSGLSAGDYQLDISRSGYQDYSQVITVSDAWQKTDVSLSP